MVTKVTYRTYPAIREIVKVSFNLTYTEASYRSFLKTWSKAQPAFTANHISGYMTFTPTAFFGDLMVHNSADVDAANATMESLYKFAEEETAGGRSVQIQKAFTILPSYFSLFSIPLDELLELNFGAGSVLVAGSRLVPLSLFQGDRVDDLINVLMNSPLSLVFLSECLLSKHPSPYIQDIILPRFPSLNTDTDPFIISCWW